MKTKEYIELLLMTQDECYDYVLAEATRLNKVIHKSKGNYIYIENNTIDSTPLLLSHLDTVDTHTDFNNISTPIVTLEDIIIKDTILSIKETSNCVLGGDDRSGVWLMLQLLRQTTPYNFLFCCDEEVGGFGSTQFVDDGVVDYYIHSCFISLDRRGKSEVATYGCDNKELIKVFTDEGYNEVQGSFTDCMILSESCDVACINLSVGYANEHSNREIQHIPTLEYTYNKLMDINIQDKLVDTNFTYEIAGLSDYAEISTPMLCDYCGQHLPLWQITPYLMCCEDCKEY